MVNGTMMVGIGIADEESPSTWGARPAISRGVNFVDAGVIGVAQALAVVPAYSRSGITITAGLFRNINREAAARFLFPALDARHRRGGGQGSLRYG